MDVLRVCDEIEKAGEKARRVMGPPHLDSRDFDHWEVDIRDYLALAANHAQDLAALVRRLAELVVAVEDWKNNGEFDWNYSHDKTIGHLLEGLVADYPGLFGGEE